MHQLLTSRAYIALELTIIAAVIPLMLMGPLPHGALFGVLWLQLCYCAWIYRKLQPSVTIKTMWNKAALRDRAFWRATLTRFGISAVAMAVLVLVMAPERFLEFPLQRTPLWAMVMVFYPLISVVPQEFIFRTYFFERYKTLFPTPLSMILASALTFGFAHILMHNLVAVLLSAVGGFYFASTYYKGRSLAQVWAEHVLYGCFVFTIGLGYYFYSGAAHSW